MAFIETPVPGITPKGGGFVETPVIPEEDSQFWDDAKAGVAGLLHGLVPSAAALAGAGVGSELGTPLGPAGMIGGALVGGLVGGLTAGAAQEAVLPEDIKQSFAETEQAHPKSTFAGELASNLPMLGVGAATKTVRGVMAAVGGGQETARELISGEDISPAKIGMATVAGAAETRVTKLGGKIAPAFKETPISKPSPEFKETPVAKTTVVPQDLPSKPEHLDTVVAKWTKDNNEAAAESTIGESVPAEVTPKEGSKQKLARTDKEGNIHLNTEAILQDYKDGFPYIYNPDSPTGVQKAAVFEQLDLPKDKFKDIVRTPEQYVAFIQAHEQSHVANGDHAAYPRTPEGKLDLMHPEAIKIEARATLDGLAAVKKMQQETPHPASVGTEEDFHTTGQKILREQGPEAAKKFATEVAEYRHMQDVPVGHTEGELADSLHNLDTKVQADRSEAMILQQHLEGQGITKEMLEKFYDYKEGHGKLTPQELEAYNMSVGKWDKELTALYERQVKLGRELPSELDQSFMTRIRLWAPKNVKETLAQMWERMHRQEGAFADKVQGDPTILEKRNLFVLEKDSGKRTVIQKIGKSVYTWEKGKRSSSPIIHGVEDIKALELKGATIKEATVNELHEHTPYRYSKDSALVTLKKLNELRQFDRFGNFLDNWKNSDTFKQVATNDNNNVPKGWITPSSIGRLPQLAGYFFEPKTAWVIEDFAKHFDNTMYMKFTSALIKNMMLNPLPHIFNEAMHVFAARGATGWVNPLLMNRFIKTGRQAFQDVWNQSELYREVMREGGAIMSSDMRANQFHDMMMDKAAKEAFPEIQNIAVKAGLSPLSLYQSILKASNKTMWMARDAMYLQLIREYKVKNPTMTTKEAVAKVEQHMPNYRVPTTVLGSRKLSAILQNPNVSVFSKYHYGLVNSMAHVVKDMNPKNLGTKEGRVEFRKGLDSALAYSLGMLVMYPLMDSMAKAIFGDSDATEQRKAGPFHMIDAIIKVSEGEKDTQALLSPIFTFNPVLLAGSEIFFNRKLYSGRHVYETNDTMPQIATDIGKYVEHAIPQAGAIMDTSEIEGGWIAKQMDIKTRSEAAQERSNKALVIKERERRARLAKYERENR